MGYGNRSNPLVVYVEPTSLKMKSSRLTADITFGS
jgi:hypothetical protein